MSARVWNSDPRSELIQIIRQVRRRWRLKLAARGAAYVLAFGVVLLLGAAYGLEAARFSAGSIVSFRIAVSLAFATLIGFWFVKPLLRQVTDEQVALYIEEHEPSLQATIVSAVDASRAGGPTVSPASDALVRRVVERAIENCADVDAARGIERPSLRRYGAVVATTLICALAVFLLGPAYLRHGLSALVVLSGSVEAAAPYRIEVSPGHATVPKGADQTIAARLHGFDSDTVSLMLRRTPNTPFERMALVRAESGAYDGILFDLSGPVDYFVEAAGVRSPVFTLKVTDLPYVKRLDLEYHFPHYTGLEPRKIESGGDIAVLRGTEVLVRVIPTMKAGGGRVILQRDATPAGKEGAAAKETSATLTVGPDGVLTGRFTVEAAGFYRIELDATTGEHVNASPQYTIDALTDQTPTVWFSKPGRDTTATPIEELFVEARAEDDYGVRNLELVYSANGGPEKVVKLFDGRNRLADVTAGHTFYLEELEVQPGDSVSYFARATDNNGALGAKQATSDIYFVRIRSLRKEFREAQSQAGGGGGAGGPVDALSEQQRQIIAATFNVQRDRKTSSADKVREATVVVALAQAKLREQVETLVTRLNSRLVEQDPAFKKVAELLPQAVTEMKAAEGKLQAVSPEGALPPEHRALRLLQKAEEEYEVQVSMSRGGGGAGGGGSGAMAEDLADLFELELDRMANQYETMERGAQQNADQQIDELMEKLKELARRQEQEAERQRRNAAAGQGHGGGAAQRALADQAEEAARRLEKLSREENRPELAQSARRMREAADAMRRAAASGDPAAAGQAAAALQRLRDAERQVQQSASARAERDVEDAVRQADELLREQQEIADEMRALSGGAEGQAGRAQQLAQRKEQLESRVTELENHLDRSAAATRREQPDASRKLSEAGATSREKRIRDKIRYSRALMSRRAPPETRQGLEADITSSLEAVKDKLGEAKSALGGTKPDSMTQALEKARRIARGLESLEQRMRERARAERGEQGKDGKNQKGENGQGEGQQGQEGDRGSRGGQGGRNNQGETSGGRGGDGDTRGDWTGGRGHGDRRPGPGPGYTPQDVRQFRGEARQWANEVQQLRGLLREGKIDQKELDAVLRALRELDDERVYHDAAELERLQTFAAEGVKRFEYGLRRRADADGTDVVLSGSDEVPEQFRPMVEQYYRSLSKTPK